MSALKAGIPNECAMQTTQMAQHDAVAVEVPDLAKFSALLLCRRGAFGPLRTGAGRAAIRKRSSAQSPKLLPFWRWGRCCVSWV
jgi:hypothetical protein